MKIRKVKEYIKFKRGETGGRPNRKNYLRFESTHYYENRGY